MRTDFLERHYKLLVIAMLIAFSLQVLYQIYYYERTTDEYNHINRAYKYFRTGEYSDQKHMPITALNALPLILYDFPPSALSNHTMWEAIVWEKSKLSDDVLRLARIPTMLYGILLGLFVFLWSRDLFGVRAGLLALFLYSFEPNILAHSSLVTTDIALTSFAFISTYFFYKFVKNISWKRAVGSGCSLGIALLTKATAVILLPVICAL